MLDNFPAGQVEHLAQGIIVGEAGLVPGDLAELSVQPLNDIGRVYFLITVNPMIPGFLLPSADSFPFYFPLRTESASDIALHAFGAFLLHLIGDMAVYIERIELDRLREIRSKLKMQTSQMQMDEKEKNARTELAQKVSEGICISIVVKSVDM